MGVPTFFLSIIKNKNYKNVHSGVNPLTVNCDYFFLDYNGIVYKAYERIKKNIEGNNMTKNKIEEMIIEEVMRYTKHLICNVVKPTKVTYIALDGPAPRAKMVQQRSRRYKGYFDKLFLKNEKIRLGVSYDDNEWDRSANISPGTEFMTKLSNALILMMKNKGFSDHNKNMQVILSDSNIPGEGEHKFLPLIKQMRKKKSYENTNIYMYGSDADLIILSMSTHKNNIHIIREMQTETKELRELYASFEFVQINIDNLKNAFNHELTRTFKNHTYDKVKILNDYVFLTFLVGNDFVLSMPFLKIRKDGLKILIAIYHNIKEKHNGYLVDYDPDGTDLIPKLNINFFKELMNEVSLKEDFEMKNQQELINKLMKGFKDNRRSEDESKKTPFDIINSRYSHLEVCSPDHPLFEKYHMEFKKINYKQEYELWKKEYYKYYFNVNVDNETEYLNIRMELVKNYLESLMFNLNYYFNGVPSWQWHYRYTISPLISDICHVLNNNIINMNEIKFDLGEPYTPFQQLMFILPPQMNELVPTVLRPIMLDDKNLCTQFYPINFVIDVVTGIKTIYSEAILPEINEDLLLNTVKKFEEKLSVEEKKRNVISEKPKMV
jgi:5'-3' exoribonuclease 1